MTTTPDTTPGTTPDIEELLRAALTARAELVQPEDLAPLATVTPLRPRWQSPWVLLATAAVVLLVLGVVWQGAGGRPRSDDVAPRPDGPQVVIPDDVGRDWKADDLTSPARLDLDGDGTNEKVVFLSEPTKNHDGRVRLQTTLSSTGEEAYGIADLASTIGVTARGAVDADGDGDQELVVPYEDLAAVGGLGHPLVYDLRDGLLVQVGVEDADLLAHGNLQVPGSETEYYDRVWERQYDIVDGELVSTRSRNAFARGNMTLMRPETIVLDRWRWTLGEDGILRHEDAGCIISSPEAEQPCAPGDVDDLPVVSPVATETFGEGEQADFDEGVAFTVGIEDGDPAVFYVEGPGDRVMSQLVNVPDPQINGQQPTSLFYDGASLVLTSASDPGIVQVFAQSGDTLSRLMPVGEITPATEEGQRTWLTQNGALVTVVAGDDGTWQSWQWVWAAGDTMAAVPTGTVCFDDVEDPSTVRRC